jgi:AcrR family transcriptional regulator
MRTRVTADRILEAALPLFAAHGYGGASMEQVRRDAGVSNGSLYHHFPRRADMAARLLMSGMRACQEGVVAVLTSGGPPEASVREVVRTQLGWVEEHAELARLLYADLPDEVLLAAEPTFSAENRGYVEVVGGWLRDQADDGMLADLPFPLAHALWLGPAQEFARHWLRGRAHVTPTEAADDLAEGAYRALAPR